MRTLFVTRWSPLRSDGGAAMRNAQNIAALSVLGPVDVLSIGGEEENEEAPVIEVWQHFVRQSFPSMPRGAWLMRSGYHPLVDSYDHPEAEAWLAQRLLNTHYDVAVVEEISLARYISCLRKADVRIIYDAHNVEAQLRVDLSTGGGPIRERLRNMLFDWRLRKIEGGAMAGADLVWACSDLDAEVLRRLHDAATPIAVVPNAVDVDAYASARHGQDATPDPEAPVELLYMGSFGYRPNVDAALELAEEVLPAMRGLGARARLTLVGREPTPEMERIAADDPDIVVTGPVPSMLSFLSRPSLMPVPLRHGSGTRLKVLEAFAAGCAVVSTAKGVEGIALQDGVEARIAETPQAFAEQLLFLWRNASARRAQVTAAATLVKERYSWAVAGEQARRSLNCIQGLNYEREI